MSRILVILAILALPGTSSAAAEADILIAFDNSYTDSVGGDENAEVLTANAVAASNWIHEQSGTGARMRICGYHKTFGQAGRSTLGGYINWMANPGDGELDDVSAAADASGADLVAFICEPVAGETSAAVAQQPGRYAAYGPTNFWNNVVAHESGGHNYGCDHRDGHQDPKTIMLHNYCGGGSQGYFSSPNTWLNGVRLQGDGSCLGGTAGAGGDNAYLISTAAQGVADRNPRVLWGSNLYPIVQRWQFNRAAGAAPAGTTVTSEVGGAPAIVRGQGATFTGTGLRLPGGTDGNTAANSIAAYIDLPNGLFSSMPDFTIEIWATPLSARNWMRVIEFGRITQAGDGLGEAGEITGTPGSPASGATDASDVIGLSACTSTGSLDDQRLIAGVGGSHQVADSNLATTAGGMHHYAITFADTPAGAKVKWFRDGDRIRTLEVPFDSAAINDVNVWLGRSQWSGDDLAHIEYHDLRVQGVALEDGQVAANYRIGPHDAVATLWASDPWGASGFVSGAWEFGSVPGPTRDYETGTLLLRTPRNANPVNFPGRSLAITGGSLHLDATGARTTTVDDLRLSGATIGAFGDGGGVQTLAGRITVEPFTENLVRGGSSPLDIDSEIAGGVGGGGMHYVGQPVTLNGDNTGYLGATIIGDGRFGTLRIGSETNLGGNPTYYGGAWLQLNRGILETTRTMTLDDPNRGILIGPSGGFLNAWAGTTLTLATPVNSPAAGNTLQTAPMVSNPIQGILFVNGGGTVELTHPNNSHNAEIQVLWGALKLAGDGRLNNGDHWMPVTVNGQFECGSALDQNLRGTLSGDGSIVKDGTGTLELGGSNPFTGTVTVNGGSLYAKPGNGAADRALSHVSGITVNDGGTLRSGPNGLFGWDGTQERPVTVNAGGTLTTDGGLTSDVGVGLVTLHGGTLATLSGGATDWGSWRFDDATDRLRVTADSTVSAEHVKFGSAGAAIEVSSGRTLNFTGTITDTTYGGISHLTKTGTGTLALAGANAYSGATSIQSGTVLVEGSISAASPVSLAPGATLGGSGTVGGPTALDGTHRPGNGVGTQSFGGTLGYGSSSVLRWELGANGTDAGSHDRVSVAGAVTIANGARVDVVLNGAGSSVALDDPFWSQPRSWTFLSGASVTGAFRLGTVSADPSGRSLDDYGTLSIHHQATSSILSYIPHTPHERWLRTHFGDDWDKPAVAGDAVDGDGDGACNLLERATGGDPMVFESDLLPVLDETAPLLSIVYRRAVGTDDLDLRVTESADPASAWIPASGTSQVIADDGTIRRIRFTRPADGNGPLFLRLEVSRP